ncbi:MAG: hypothetical protein E7254_09590 [Lachnospiraceae bacterium]|nr:hypothetical protein [Lachnospiraceae bacterium]
MSKYDGRWLEEQIIPKYKVKYSEETLEDLNDDFIPCMLGNESIEETHPVLKSEYAEFSIIMAIVTIFMALKMGKPLVMGIADAFKTDSVQAFLAELPWLVFFLVIIWNFAFISISGYYKTSNVNRYGKLIEGKVCGITKVKGRNSMQRYIVLINTRRGYRWLETHLPSNIYEKGEIVKMKIYKDWVVAEKKKVRLKDVL